MGIASRRKRERRALRQRDTDSSPVEEPFHFGRAEMAFMERRSVVDQRNSDANALTHGTDPWSGLAMLDNDPIPPVVYRFFGQESWADDFAAGKVWVATLDDFRDREELRRGDAGEGHERRRFAGVGGSDSEKFVRDASMVGAVIGKGSSNISLSIQYNHHLPNCWVICTTPVHLPDEMTEYGQYCVEITDVVAFQNAVGNALARKTLMECGWPTRGWRGHVRYQSREVDVATQRCGPIGFVKPDIPEFVRDREYRLLYVPARPEGSMQGNVPVVKGCLVDVPEVRQIVRRIS